jgi:hypothetical protein
MVFNKGDKAIKTSSKLFSPNSCMKKNKMLKKPHFPRQCQKKKKKKAKGNERTNYLHAIDNIYTLIHKLRGHLLLRLSINIFHFLHSRPLLTSTWQRKAATFYYYYYWETRLLSAYSLLIFFIPDQFCSCLCSDGGTNSWQKILNRFCFCVWHVKKALSSLLRPPPWPVPSFWFCLAGFSC